MAEQHGKTLVPQIRFAGFTDPWEQRKLSDLTDRVSIQSSDSDLPQVEYEDIIPGEGTLNKDLRDKKGGKTGIKFYAGDVLYGKLRPYLMNWLYPQFNGVAVGDFWVLRATECDSSFLYRLVQTGSFQRLANVSSGSKMPRADWNLISQSFFAVPADHAEQKAIAKGLAELDTLITLHQRKYDKLCVLKKSMLDKMLPKGGSLYPEIRFAGFTDPWEQRKLGDVARRVTRKNENRDSDLPLTISAQYGLVDQRTFFNNQVASKDMSGYFLLHKGEFAYNKSTSTDSPWGAIKRLEKYDMGCVSTLYICFELLSGDPDFLVTYYETDRWYKAVQLIAAEGARNHGLLNIAPDDFFETQICIPKRIDEQRQIGAFFDRLDSLITLHQRKLELLRNIKKSMLDKMFV
ncbi:restriction endonuclease subunit S [Bifidobacterium adolescentis]|uniref:hypothetical protein n=1 Tax=Bifidobacterium adolescentis TaxID=1680 RepID=UPI00406282E3